VKAALDLFTDEERLERVKHYFQARVEYSASRREFETETWN
jgi:hypothetical protein